MYNKEKILEQSLKIIRKEQIVFLDDLISLIPCSKSTFYEWCYNQNESILEALEANKSSLKRSLRNKWLKSDNATVQIALYKLLSTPIERSILCNKEPTEPKEGVQVNVYKKYENTGLEHLENEELEQIASIYKKAEDRRIKRIVT